MVQTLQEQFAVVIFRAERRLELHVWRWKRKVPHIDQSSAVLPICRNILADRVPMTT